MSKHRDPIQGEFFNTEAIRHVVNALIREAIQNSLDAREADTVHVRFYVSGTTGALPQTDAETYFASLWPHIEACDAQAFAQLRNEPCRFLVLEDFGTSGLTGDPADMFEADSGDDPNHFYYFFRAEGKSGKSGADRGRWGVGKYVFPKTSELNGLFALTVRSDACSAGGRGPLLMGQSVLQNHPVDGTHFEPDGWYADLSDDDEPLPVTDATEIQAFRDDWQVARTDEPGLSVVVPFSPADIDIDAVRNALVRDYFIAFLDGDLTATIESPDLDTSVMIDAATIRTLLDQLDDEHDDDGRRHLVNLAAWARDLPDDEYTVLEQISGEPKWARELLSKELSAGLQAKLQRGERVAARVPVHVAPQRKGAEVAGAWSHVDVVLEPVPGERPAPLFSREGIIISDVRATPVSGIRALVLISDEPVARMFGDAEGPAHTTWSASTHKFAGTYRYGRNWIAFVKNSVAGLVRLIRGDDEEEDRSLASDVFWVQRPTTVPQPPRPGAKGDGEGTTSELSPEPPTPTPRAVRVDRIEGGFSVRLTGERAVDAVEVRVAYDSRGGNPFKHYSEYDFKLLELDREVGGLTITVDEPNRLVLKVDDADEFEFTVTGFDTSRDLIVNARAVEVPT